MNREDAPFLAQEEQQRADNTVRFIANTASDPARATHGSLAIYQECARRAYATAARYTEQPERGPR